MNLSGANQHITYQTFSFATPFFIDRIKKCYSKNGDKWNKKREQFLNRPVKSIENSGFKNFTTAKNVIE